MLRNLRLVSRRFIHLATPIHLRRLSIIGPGARLDADASLPGTPRVQFQRLRDFLLSRPPPLDPAYASSSIVDGSDSSDDSCSSDDDDDRGKRPMRYGHHVKEVVFCHRVFTLTIRRVLEDISELAPNLVRISGLFTRLYSPSLLQALSQQWRPALTALTEINLPHRPPDPVPPMPNGDEAGQVVPPVDPNLDEWSTRQEALFDVVNAHPGLDELGVDELWLDAPLAERLLSILASSRMYNSLPSKRLHGVSATGLRMLHLGRESVVDLTFLRGLPSAAPAIEESVPRSRQNCGRRLTSVDRLHLFGLYNDDTSIKPLFRLSDVLRAYPDLRRFSFVANQTVNLNDELTWADASNILSVRSRSPSLPPALTTTGKCQICPRLETLNLRVDILYLSFFSSLSSSLAIPSARPLHHLSLWYIHRILPPPSDPPGSAASYSGRVVHRTLSRPPVTPSRLRECQSRMRNLANAVMEMCSASSRGGNIDWPGGNDREGSGHGGGGGGDGGAGGQGGDGLGRIETLSIVLEGADVRAKDVDRGMAAGGGDEDEREVFEDAVE